MYRKPIRPASPGIASSQAREAVPANHLDHGKGSFSSAVYSVMWRKKTLKVHKTWEGDGEGVVIPNSTGGGSILTVKADGLNLGSVKLNREGELLEEGQVLSSGRFEFEIGALISTKARKDASAPRESTPISPSSTTSSSRSLPAELTKPFKTVSNSNVSSHKSPVIRDSKDNRLDFNAISAPNSFKTIPGKASNPNATSEMKPAMPSPHLDLSLTPLSASTVTEKAEQRSRKGLNPPNQASEPIVNKKRPALLGMAPLVGHLGAPLELNPFVTLRPTSHSTKKHKLAADSHIPANQLQIDATLKDRLRPHQVEAVKFLYESVTGQKHIYGQGAILADDMGLGKTLTAITLIDSLLKSRCIRHALVVCPVTLVANWRAEFRKWMPKGSQIGTMVVDQRGMGNGSLKDPVRAFFGDRSFRVHQVMIVGYERTRLISTKLIEEDKQFDLVVCDEGHKLKAAGSKTAEAIASIVGDKRVLLTGTPIQNNLNEFWALADFVNPGVFGTEAQFTRRYVAPLDGDSQKSHEALDELSEICDEFMLRRDTSVLSKYLNVPKTEYAVFCRPTPAQSHEYIALTAGASQLIDSGSSSFDQGACLQAITELKKTASGLATQGGGKLAFLKQLLMVLRKNSNEKIVIVSGSTKVLDLCQELCITLRLQWLRLDGQTPQERRQGMVDKFNKHPPDVAFAFLLSSRSGGMGLNLIGGSRLVLVDCDWNPSIDAQAMARIHRDGQMRACRIYRLLSTGTIDEKIFQRQLSKIGLSTNVLVESTGISSRRAPQFTREQLQDLFTYSQPELCNTLDMLPESESLKGYVCATTTDDEILNMAVRATQNVSCILEKK